MNNEQYASESGLITPSGVSRRTVIGAGAAAAFTAAMVMGVKPETAAAYTGGNGDIDPSTLTPIIYDGVSPVSPSHNPMLLRPDCAVAFKALLVAYHETMGGYLPVDEGYRDLATQWYWWNNSAPGNASYPGTSNHGYGIAVDFYQNYVTVGSGYHNWLVSHAAEFGFTPLSSEAWHWNYTGNYNPGTPPPPVAGNKEIDEMAYAIVQDQTHDQGSYAWIAIYGGGVKDGWFEISPADRGPWNVYQSVNNTQAAAGRGQNIDLLSVDYVAWNVLKSIYYKP